MYCRSEFTQIVREYDIERVLPLIMSSYDELIARYPDVSSFEFSEFGFDPWENVTDEEVIKIAIEFNMTLYNKLVEDIAEEISGSVSISELRVLVRLQIERLYLDIFREKTESFINDRYFNGFKVRGIGEDGEMIRFVSPAAMFKSADMSDCYNVDVQYQDKLGKWKPVRFKRLGVDGMHIPVNATTQEGVSIAFGYFTDH